MNFTRKIFFRIRQFAYDHRLLFIVPLQILIISVAFLLAFLVRFDLSLPIEFRPIFVQLLPAVIIVKTVVFWKFDLFKGWWRYVSMPDLIQVFRGNLIASIGVLVYAVVVHRLQMVPRSVLFLDGTFCLLLMGGVRFATRALRENYLPVFLRQKDKRRILIFGAGSGGQAIAREYYSNPALDVEVVGFIDDDNRKLKQHFHGLKVLGRGRDLPGIVISYKVDEVIIAIPSATGKQLQSIVRRCDSLSVNFKVLPGMGELLNGKVVIQSLRQINLEDLLGRAEITLEQDQISAYLRAKRVFISGAGGSIGSEICRQVARYRPEKLILFDNAETPLFRIERELSERFPDIRITPVIGDIRNPARLAVIFDEQLPQVVFHAAAYKHVPMMELNPAEAVNNNVRGTKLLADTAEDFGVETFVMISTDKAVKPTNVMGATKRAAEMYVQSLARNSKTRFVTTRFGNVLGSNGSVVPIFTEQINAGGPVKVTHPEVTRYFMTITEATQLVLQAGSMGNGGEIYLFDMGKPIKVVDLAEEMIRLSGLQPYEDIDIVFTGLRPGEKLYEELLLAEEGSAPTRHDKICVAKSVPLARELLMKKLEMLFSAAKDLDLAGVRSQLQSIVPEYFPADNKQKAKVIPHPASVIHQ